MNSNMATALLSAPVSSDVEMADAPEPRLDRIHADFEHAFRTLSNVVHEMEETVALDYSGGLPVESMVKGMLYLHACKRYIVAADRQEGYPADIDNNDWILLFVANPGLLDPDSTGVPTMHEIYRQERKIAEQAQGTSRLKELRAALSKYHTLTEPLITNDLLRRMYRLSRGMTPGMAPHVHEFISTLDKLALHAKAKVAGLSTNRHAYSYVLLKGYPHPDPDILSKSVKYKKGLAELSNPASIPPFFGKANDDGHDFDMRQQDGTLVKSMKENGRWIYNALAIIDDKAMTDFGPTLQTGDRGRRDLNIRLYASSLLPGIRITCPGEYSFVISAAACTHMIVTLLRASSETARESELAADFRNRNAQWGGITLEANEFAGIFKIEIHLKEGRHAVQDTWLDQAIGNDSRSDSVTKSVHSQKSRGAPQLKAFKFGEARTIKLLAAVDGARELRCLTAFEDALKLCQGVEGNGYHTFPLYRMSTFKDYESSFTITDMINWHWSSANSRPTEVGVRPHLCTPDNSTGGAGHKIIDVTKPNTNLVCLDSLSQMMDMYALATVRELQYDERQHQTYSRMVHSASLFLMGRAAGQLQIEISVRLRPGMDQHVLPTAGNNVHFKIHFMDDYNVGAGDAKAQANRVWIGEAATVELDNDDCYVILLNVESQHDKQLFERCNDVEVNLNFEVSPRTSTAFYQMQALQYWQRTIPTGASDSFHPSRFLVGDCKQPTEFINLDEELLGGSKHKLPLWQTAYHIDRERDNDQFVMEHLDFLFNTLNHLEGKELNEEQRSIADAIRTKLVDGLALLIGPPGCGKSHTAAYMAVETMLKCETVIVSAKTNVAVRALMEKVQGLVTAMSSRGNKLEYLMIHLHTKAEEEWIRKSKVKQQMKRPESRVITNPENSLAAIAYDQAMSGNSCGYDAVPQPLANYKAAIDKHLEWLRLHLRNHSQMKDESSLVGIEKYVLDCAKTAEAFVLQEMAHCVFATADTLACKLHEGVLRNFPTLIMDEVSQMTMVEFLAATAHNPSLHRVVLAGDPDQLNPSPQSAAAMNEAGNLLKMTPFRHDWRVVNKSQEYRLTINLRNPQAMLDLVNSITYNDTKMPLVSGRQGETEFEKEHFPLTDLPRKFEELGDYFTKAEIDLNQQRVIFLDCGGVAVESASHLSDAKISYPNHDPDGTPIEFAATTRKGKMHYRGVECAVKLVRDHIAAGVDPSKITSLSAWKWNSEEITKMLKRDGIDVNACTVHKYQGDENDIVIVNLVDLTRTGMNNLKANLINVAATRATTITYFIGDRKSLSESAHSRKNVAISRLYDYLLGTNGFVDVRDAFPSEAPELYIDSDRPAVEATKFDAGLHYDPSLETTQSLPGPRELFPQSGASAPIKRKLRDYAEIDHDISHPVGQDGGQQDGREDDGQGGVDGSDRQNDEKKPSTKKQKRSGHGVAHPGQRRDGKNVLPIRGSVNTQSNGGANRSQGWKKKKGQGQRRRDEDDVLDY